MAITTAEAFLAVLEKSDLLTTEQLAEAQDATLLTGYASELSEMLIQQDLITPWQATQLLAGRSSLFLGNYALMDLLGRGGMGSVFLAQHRTMKRRVALKVVSKQVGKDPASTERFLAEARLIASLDHPNIVQAYDVDKESDRFYIVMEYIEGQDLEAIVQEHGLFGFEEVADCIRQAADGLAHAHGRNMIHCDIKPSNLLLSDQGVIKILDMGMARLAGSGEDSGEQVDHKVLGTVDYMSPEQAMNGPDFDHRADIYSLGCTLYLLLTGRPPFDGGSLTQRIVKHQTQPPPDILEAHPDSPKELVDICMKMMAKDPADRYQSVAEVSSLLTGWHEPDPSLQPDDEHSQESQSEADQPPEQEQPIADAEAAPSGTNLAMDELHQSDAPEVAVAGPTLKNKQKSTDWSEEQQTVLLVAAAVFFAIVILSVALIVMIFRPPQTGTPSAPTAHNEPDTPSSNDDGKSQQPSENPDTPEHPSTTPPPTSPQVQDPAAKKADDTSKKPKTPTPKTTDTKPKSPKATPTKPPKQAQKKTDSKEVEPKNPEPEKPKPVDPFHELPTAVDLELLPDTARLPQTDPRPAFPLAMIHPGDNQTLKIKLIGGGAALPHGNKYSLRAVDENDMEPTWLLSLASSTTTEHTPVDVARIWFGQGVLMFEWLGAAVAESANYLKNCALDITVGGKTMTLALSRPRVVEPLLVDLASGTSTRALSESYLPDMDNLRLVVTAIESEALGGRFQINKEIEARKQVDIDVPVPNLKRTVIRVSYVVKKGKTFVELECWCQTRDAFRMVHLHQGEWIKYAKRYDAMEKKQYVIQQKRNITALDRKKLDSLKTRLAEMKSLVSLRDAVHGKGKLYFREYLVDNSRRVELTTTDAPPDEKSDEKKDGSR